MAILFKLKEAKDLQSMRDYAFKSKNYNVSIPALCIVYDKRKPSEAESFEILKILISASAIDTNTIQYISTLYSDTLFGTYKEKGILI